MRIRPLLWLAFLAVHALVAAAGYALPHQPMGDVYLVYEPWSSAAWQGSGVVGVTEPWVYPQLALLPMLLAHAPGVLVGDYTLGWALLVTAVDAVGFAILVGRARSRGRRAAAWFWLAAALALGPVGMYRVDAITVPIVIVAGLWLVRRPAVAAGLLAAATWIKVWPAALLTAAVIAVRRRLAIVAGAAAVCALVAGTVLVAGGAENLLGFVSGQTGRGLQLEAPVSTPYVWGAVLGLDGFWVYYDPEILTFQVTGTQIDVTIALMTPVLALAALAVAGLGVLAARRGVPFVRLFPLLALTLVLVLIVTNKVGSPQFQTWLFPVLVVGLVLDRARWRWPAVVVLGVAALTQLVYPVLYQGVLDAEPIAVGVLTLRNVALVALLVWMLVRLVRWTRRLGIGGVPSIP